MIVYVLKFSACLGILMLFYRFFLEKEHMHLFKRFYLLVAILMALLIPLVTFTKVVEVATIAQIAPFEAQGHTSLDQVPKKTLADSLPMILWGIYSFGALLFAIQFFRNLGQIIRRIRSNPKHKTPSVIRVLLGEPVLPHTFFKYIFLNKQRYEAKEIPDAVLLHEETHALQKHSLDVLFIELLQIVFWFNPMVYLAKRAIRLNHEFLADHAVLEKGIPPSRYQNILLAYSSQALPPLPLTIGMANSLNYSSIKKRMSVMRTRTSKKSIILRTMLLLPLLALLLEGFSETKLVQKVAVHTVETQDSLPGKLPIFEAPVQKGATEQQLSEFNVLAKKYNAQPQKSRRIPLMDLKILEDIYSQMSPFQKDNALPFPECPPFQEGATEDQIEEYNAIVKRINAQPENRRIYKKREVEQLEFIFSLMTAQQKKKAEPYPEFPPMPEPPAPRAPKEAMPPSAVRAPKQPVGIRIIEVPVAPEAPDAPELPEIEEPVLIFVEEIGEVAPPEAPEPPESPEPPMSPLDHVVEMAKADATFYYEGKKIGSDKAIEILKKNDDVNIDIIAKDRKHPVVKLSKDPFVIKN